MQRQILNYSNPFFNNREAQFVNPQHRFPEIQRFIQRLSFFLDENDRYPI